MQRSRTLAKLSMLVLLLMMVPRRGAVSLGACPADTCGADEVAKQQFAAMYCSELCGGYVIYDYEGCIYDENGCYVDAEVDWHCSC